jgi:ribosomal protein S7
MVISAREKTTHNPMSERLAEEIINAYQGTGSAFKRKEDIRKEIENR